MMRNGQGHVAQSRRRQRGFTLIEAAMTTVIIGVGFMAMLQLLAAGTASNIEGAQTTTGINLAKNVREMSLKLPFAQIRGLDGRTYAPPIDSRGVSISGFGDWSQKVTVQAVDPARLTLDISDSLPVALRVTVTVVHNTRRVCNVSWYAFNGTP